MLVELDSPLLDGADPSRATTLRRAMRRVLEWYVFGALPLLAFCWWMGQALLDTGVDVTHWGFDSLQFWRAGRDVVDGESPYPTKEAIEGVPDDVDAAGLLAAFRFAYPAAAALGFAPLGLLGFDVAAVVWSAILVACVLVALVALDVRDWRVFGVVLGSAPVISAVRNGTLTPVLLLLLALAWRWRDRRWHVSGSVAAMIALKLFLWPLVLWLAVTRRWLEALSTVVIATAATLAAWAAIGFDGLTSYPALLRRLTDIVEERGYSLVALGVELGAAESSARALLLVVGVPLLVGVVISASRADGDRVSFSLATAAAIALSPIVWPHYFALLIVPLAVARPRLSWAWGLMWLFWLTPTQQNGGKLWPILAAAFVALAVVAASSRATRGAAARALG